MSRSRQADPQPRSRFQHTRQQRSPGSCSNKTYRPRDSTFGVEVAIADPVGIPRGPPLAIDAAVADPVGID